MKNTKLKINKVIALFAILSSIALIGLPFTDTYARYNMIMETGGADGGESMPVVSTGNGQAVFNNDPLDFPTLQVANYTKNPGCTTCWSTSIAGVENNDIISFDIYYHNTSNIVAYNTYANLGFSYGPNYINAIGNITADNASAVSGDVFVGLSSGVGPANLVFHSASWFPNQGSNGQSISGNTSFSLGDVGPGWPYQGHVVARFKVVSQGPQISAPIVTTDSATNISQTSATLNGTANPNNGATNTWFEWGENASLGNITPQQPVGAGNTNINFSYPLANLQPNKTYSFRAVAQNSQGIVRGVILTFTTFQISQPTSTAPFIKTVDASNIGTTSATLNGIANPQGDTMFAWFDWGEGYAYGTNSTNQQSIGSGNGNKNFSITLTGLQPNTTYSFKATGKNSFASVSAMILTFTTLPVNPQNNPPSANTEPATAVTTNQAVLNSFINPNGLTTDAWFEWGSGGNLSNSTIRQSIGNGPLGLNFTHNLTGLISNIVYSFRVVAQNSAGTSFGDVLTFKTQNIPPPQGMAPKVVTVDAVPGQNSASLSGTVNPNGDSTSAWFEWGLTQSLGNTTPLESVGSGNSDISINKYISSLQPNTTYYYRAAAQNNFGTAYGAILTFTTQGSFGSPPSVITTGASDITVNSATLHGIVVPNSAPANVWFEWGNGSNLNRITPSQPVGTGFSDIFIGHPISGLEPNTTYSFRAVAENTFGKVMGATHTFTTKNIPMVGMAPIVITRPATKVGWRLATLNGLVNPGSSDTNAWFEIGETYNLGSRVIPDRLVGDGSAYVDYNITAATLRPLTKYYFRAVAQNQYGTGYGDVLTFMTIAIPPEFQASSNSTIVSSPTVIASPRIQSMVNSADSSSNDVSNNQQVISYANNSADASMNNQPIVANDPPSTVYSPVTNRITVQNQTRINPTAINDVESNIGNRITIDSGSTSRTVINDSAIGSNTNSNLINQHPVVIEPVSNPQTSNSINPVIEIPKSSQNPGQASVTTGLAINVSGGQVTINGLVLPNGYLTAAWFKYGANASLLDKSTKTEYIQWFKQQTFPDGISLVGNVSGLKSGTTYYYQVFAKSSAGEVSGRVMSFVAL
jgi:hypothetical protein